MTQYDDICTRETREMERENKFDVETFCANWILGNEVVYILNKSVTYSHGSIGTYIYTKQMNGANQ